MSESPAELSPERPAESNREAAPLGGLVTRSALGGALMGLANLVPGISGGTMLLAAGVYPRFIGAIGEVTTLKFRKASVVCLGTVVAAALFAIVFLAGVVKTLVVEQRWAMYSLFIGLTLGGVPVVWRLLKASGVDEARERSGDRGWWIAAVLGFVAMAGLALVQSSGVAGGGGNDGFVFMLLAGVAGAAAMILPGVSGGYLLLVLGVYVPILTGIDGFKEALSSRDVEALFAVGLAVVLPVGLGVVIGIVGVSNLLRWLLKRYERATLGVLLGLLLGAVVGLWPFQQSVEPEAGMIVKGQAIEQDVAGVWVLQASLETVEMEDLPTAFFTPSAGQVAGALGLMLLGFGVTMGVDRLGREKKQGM
ncbi:MAG: DUF368 domain-containing protein [Planctomycetota bacterium]